MDGIGPCCLKLRNLGDGMMLLERMNLIVRLCSAMAIQEWVRATSCKRVYHCRISKDGIADRLR